LRPDLRPDAPPYRQQLVVRQDDLLFFKFRTCRSGGRLRDLGHALTDDAAFSFTLDSDNPNLGHTVQVDLPRLAPAVCCKSQSFL